jgi:hypothetical protein
MLVSVFAQSKHWEIDLGIFEELAQDFDLFAQFFATLIMAAELPVRIGRHCRK